MLPSSLGLFAPVFAALPEFPRLGESLQFQFNGLIVVFTALLLIWALVEIMGAAFRFRAQRTAAPAAPKPVAAPVVPAGPTPEIIAVITAAVHVALGGVPHRIQGIAPLGIGPDWAREGRRNIFASHQPR